MKKLLLPLILWAMFLHPAQAATPHYGFNTPVVGSSQNQWGTLLNAIFGQIDTDLWSASDGTTISVNTPASSSSNITLTNPMARTQNISFSGTGHNLVLPAMNATSSMVVGGNLYINNVGSNAFRIVATDGTSTVLGSLLGGQSISLQLLTNGTANGTFQIYGPYLASVPASSSIAFGTAAATTNPSISTDITTGLYTSGASKVDMAIGGNNTVDWNASGTNMSGVLAFTTTSAVTTGQTGIHQSSANALSVSTTGVDRVTVAADGGVVVGPATGGTKGPGTINLSGAGIYVNGTISNGIVRINPQTFTSSGTYTPHAGMLYAEFYLVGGGGGGGGASGTGGGAAAGGGGGSGAFSFAVLSAATIGSSQTVTIGSGGAGGATGTSTGGNGTSSSLGALMTVAGGVGGGAGANFTSTSVSGTFGQGGTSSSGGSYNTVGSSGGNGVVYGSSSAISGFGGTPAGGLGLGFGGVSVSSNGGDGLAYGGGGAGGAATSADKPGGNGAKGGLLIVEYCTQ